MTVCLIWGWIINISLIIDISSVWSTLFIISAGCRKKLEADSLCSSVDRNEFLSLVRVDSEAVGCPFTGPRNYFLEFHQQACTDDASLVTSSTASLLKFQYPTCWVLGDPTRPVGKLSWSWYWLCSAFWSSFSPAIKSEFSLIFLFLEIFLATSFCPYSCMFLGV